MKYHEVEPISRESSLAAFSSNDVEQINNALISVAYHDPEWEWAQERCLELLEHEDVRVSGLAAVCLGHIARIHEQLDKIRVIQALEEKLKSKDPKMVERVEIALVGRGPTNAHQTVGTLIQKLKARFGLEHVVLVGGRGMVSDTTI